MLFKGKRGQLVLKTWLSCSRVFGVWRVLIVLVNDLHDERNECLDENLTALRKVAPLLEQIH